MLTEPGRRLSFGSRALHHMVSTSFFQHVLLFLKTPPKLVTGGFPNVPLFYAQYFSKACAPLAPHLFEGETLHIPPSFWAAHFAL